MKLKTFILLIIFPLWGISQNFESLRQVSCQQLYFKNGKSILLDSSTIYPKDFQLSNAALQVAKYDMASGEIELNLPITDSLKICYYKFRTNFSTPILKYKPSSTSLETPSEIFYIQNEPFTKKELLNTPKLNKNGSITRGVNVSNSQNLAVQSAMNIELDGEIAKDIYIKGIISDQEIPFQPEGNTAQIQELDKVYLELRTPQFKIAGGDIQLKNDSTYFLKYNRNIQGGLFSARTFYDSNQVANSLIGFGISKGKYAIQTLQASEGSQGPYRLRGAKNERFIIVLAGSERIWLDGNLLQRGVNNDYTIDYNLAEITFTANNVIQYTSVIRAEFEYSDREYLRTTTTFQHKHHYKKLDFNLAYFDQTDHKKRPTNSNLTLQEQEILFNAGDVKELATTENAFPYTYQDNSNTYNIDSSTYSYPIYIFTENADSQSFIVNFINVGEQKGDYKKRSELDNYAIYEYVGKNLGSYLPIKFLPLPEQQRNLSSYLAYTHKSHKVYNEVSISKRDINTFSEMNNEDNIGYANRIGYTFTKNNLLPQYKLTSNIEYQFLDEYFQGIDQFRNVEFARDWGTNTAKDSISIENEQLLTLQFELKKNNTNYFEYRFGKRLKTPLNGQQHLFRFHQEDKKFGIKSSLFYNLSEFDNRSNEWKRGNLTLIQKDKWTRKEFFVSTDRNHYELKDDNIISSQMYNNQVGVRITNSDSLKQKYELKYTYRTDFDTLNNELTPSIHSHNISVGSRIMIKKHLINTVVNYREIQKEAFIKTEMPTTSISGKLNYNGTWFKNRLKHNLFYTTASSRELKKEFVYRQVALGQGNYIFKDFNNNGVQELDEFVEEALIGNYIRLFVPTDEYINAYESAITYKANFSPKLKKALFFNRFQIKYFLQGKQKNTSDNIFERYIFNPAQGNNFFLSYKNQSRSTLSYNNVSNKLSAYLQHENRSSSVLYNTGNILNNNETYTLFTQVKTSSSTRVSLELANGYLLQDAGVLQNSTYKYYIQSIEPTWSYFFKLGKRIDLSWKYDQKESTTNIWVKGYETKLKSQFNLAKKHHFITSFSHIYVTTTGTEEFYQTPLGYQMMSALSEGNNFKWSINYKTEIMEGLLLDFRYEGRKPQKSALVHLGNLRITAIL